MSLLKIIINKQINKQKHAVVVCIYLPLWNECQGNNWTGSTCLSSVISYSFLHHMTVLFYVYIFHGPVIRVIFYILTHNVSNYQNLSTSIGMCNL